MRILIAPNAFKGTVGAAEAARAISQGLAGRFPGAGFDLLPIADGGDGLLEALRPALGGVFARAGVPGPLGEPVRARWLKAGRTAVIEMAETSGLRLCRRGALRPLDASTSGVGALMRHAALAGAKEIIVGLGGSASNDGGAGCAEAAGLELLDAAGRPVEPGVRGLAKLRRLRRVPGATWPRSVKVLALADVKNRLCGRLGSARVFGPQKGASAAEVAFMEEALRNYARILKRDLGISAAGLPRGAAAGGLGAGLAAFFGAELLDGAAFVLGRTGFAEKLRRCDALVTGEGRFDEQTFFGKAPGAAIAQARAAGKPALVLCGASAFAGPRGAGRRGVSAVVESGGFGLDAAALRRAAAGPLADALAGLFPGAMRKNI